MSKVLPKFDEINFSHIPWEENHMADALPTLAYMYKLIWHNHRPKIKIMRFNELAHCLINLGYQMLSWETRVSRRCFRPFQEENTEIGIKVIHEWRCVIQIELRHGFAQMCRQTRSIPTHEGYPWRIVWHPWKRTCDVKENPKGTLLLIDHGRWMLPLY